MNISILFNAGGIGDAVMTLPFLFSLKEHFNSQYIKMDIYTHLPLLYQLFEKELSIRVIKVSDLYYSSPFKDWYIFRKKNYEYFINLVIGRKSLIQTFAFKSKKKIFYISLNKKRINILFPFLKNYSCNEPSFFKYKKLAEALLTKELQWQYPLLNCNKTTMNRLRELLKNYLSGKIVFINPFVKDSLRNLPLDFYINLIEILRKKNFNPILIGGRDAISLSHTITNSIEVTNLVGRFSLKEFICLLNLGEAFITPDSGPLHLSFLSNIKKIIPIFTFIKPTWRIPTHYFNVRVFSIFLYRKFFKGKEFISSCWTEQDQKIASKLYPELEHSIINNPQTLIDEILEYLEY